MCHLIITAPIRLQHLQASNIELVRSVQYFLLEAVMFAGCPSACHQTFVNSASQWSHVGISSNLLGLKYELIRISLSKFWVYVQVTIKFHKNVKPDKMMKWWHFQKVKGRLHCDVVTQHHHTETHTGAQEVTWIKMPNQNALFQRPVAFENHPTVVFCTSSSHLLQLAIVC